MSKIKVYFIVFIMGIIGLLLILAFTFLSTKLMKKKKFPLENLVEILFAFSKKNLNNPGSAKKEYVSTHKTIKICEDAIVIHEKNKEKIYFYNEIGLLNSFIYMGAFSIKDYGYHIYDEKGILKEIIFNSDFEDIGDFERQITENNKWVIDILHKPTYTGKLKIPYSTLDKALARRKEINKTL